MQRLFMNFHIWLYRVTGGVIGGKVQQYAMLLLTSVGRKSGQERVTPLTYFQDGDRYIIIASNGGADKDPQWYRNIVQQPQARIQVKREVIPVTATTADPEERARLWSWVTAQAKNFAEYGTRTSREIPVVILTPAGK